jgi:hypothetical protein
MHIFELYKKNKLILSSCNLQDIINLLQNKNIKINCIDDIFNLKNYNVKIINEIVF